MATLRSGLYALVCAALTLLSTPTPAAASIPGRATEGGVVVMASGPHDDAVGAGTIVDVAGASISVLTAKHVATYGAPRVRFDDGRVAPARIVALFPGQDLALLESTLDPARAASLHAASITVPGSHLPVHVWGSGLDGPAFEPGATAQIGSALPNGESGEKRFTLTCALCHRGDSGAGVFDQSGRLIGVFVGYYTLSSGRLPIAEIPPPTLVALLESLRGEAATLATA